MFSMSTKAILHILLSTILYPLDLFWTLPGISISIYGVICNGIRFGQKLHNIVRLMHKASLCDCPKGFEPRWPGNWSMQDYSGGCIRRTPLGCSNGGIDKFLTIPNLNFGKLLGVATKINVTVQDIESCKLTCLRDCDCIAYAYYNECLIYMEQLRNLQLSSDNEIGLDLHVRISVSEQIELVGSRTKMSKKVAWILGVFAMLILLLSI
ncbi:g-type lectin s-receptor-like serine/threonine-protein kinase, partial [Quercus suber]